MCSPSGTPTQAEILLQKEQRVIVAGMFAEISIEKSQPLGARQKAPDGAIQVYQIEQTAARGDSAGAAEVFEIDEVDLPFARTARDQQVGFL